MKKVFLTLAAVVAMISFVACKSVEEKAKDYAKEIEAAYAAEDYEKAEKIEKEAEEWVKGLDSEDQMKVLKAMMEYE